MNIPGTNEEYGPFTFSPDPPQRFCPVKEAKGELRVPSLVKKARDLAAQRVVSGGTGEHAGHLIGTQFGAPGDIRNLARQNPNMNSYAPKYVQEMIGGKGGSYLQMESHWKDLLEAGARIRVTVQDRFRTNEERPFYRRVEWELMEPNTTVWKTMPLEIFGNFSSPQLRNAQG